MESSIKKYRNWVVTTKKLTPFLVAILTFFQSLAQENSFTYEADTLVITKSDLLTNPFGLGNNLISFLTKSASRIDKTPIGNLHLENQIDTVYSIHIQKDLFQIYQSQTNDILFDAIITSKNFPIHGILEIGMKKSKIKRNLKINYKGEYPDMVKITDFEYMSWLNLFFEKKRLKTIRYTANFD
jgi:hypothetical protein